MSKKITAFTLVELMVTISILAILSTIAVPSFNSFINNNKLAAVSNDLYSAVSMARSEAVKLKVEVTLSPVNNNWSNGWVITKGAEESTETLFNRGAISKGLSLDSSSSTESIVLDSSGYSRTKHWGDVGVIFCGSNKSGRKVDVTPSGTVKITKIDCA